MLVAVPGADVEPCVARRLPCSSFLCTICFEPVNLSHAVQCRLFRWRDRNLLTFAASSDSWPFQHVNGEKLLVTVLPCSCPFVIVRAFVCSHLRSFVIVRATVFIVVQRRAASLRVPSGGLHCPEVPGGGRALHGSRLGRKRCLWRPTLPSGALRPLAYHYRSQFAPARSTHDNGRCTCVAQSCALGLWSYLRRR